MRRSIWMKAATLTIVLVSVSACELTETQIAGAPPAVKQAQVFQAHDQSSLNAALPDYLNALRAYAAVPGNTDPMPRFGASGGPATASFTLGSNANPSFNFTVPNAADVQPDGSISSYPGSPAGLSTQVGTRSGAWESQNVPASTPISNSGNSVPMDVNPAIQMGMQLGDAGWVPVGGGAIQGVGNLSFGCVNYNIAGVCVNSWSSACYIQSWTGAVCYCAYGQTCGACFAQPIVGWYCPCDNGSC